MLSLCNGWEFNRSWSESFLCGEGEAEQVRLPHTAAPSPLHYSGPGDYAGICGYRRRLALKPEQAGKRVFLQLDGAAHIAEVYLNGTKLSEHRCGYTAFRTELTEGLRFDGTDRIAVRLDTTENSAVPPFGFVIDYLTYGGLYREAWLDIREKSLISDIFVMTPDLHTASVQVLTDGGYDSLRLRILDADGNCISSAAGTGSTFTLACPDASPWEPDSPALYSCEVSMVLDGRTVDVQTARFGFRTAVFTENSFLLNGKPLFLRGLNRHQCWPYIGYAAPKSLQREDARLLKEELGCTVVRTSHYPQSQHFIDACDELGLPVFTEIPGWQHIGNESWQEQAVENTREMVLQYRNHPSVILWGVRINESQDNDALYRRTNAVAHGLDPSRATSGVRYLEKSSLLEDVYAFNDFSHMGNNPGVKPKNAVTPDMKKPLLVTEHNGHMFPTKSFDTWQRRQEQALRHARVQNDAAADGGHVGCIGWCMFDYATHRDFGSGDRICYHGVMDAFRNPKTAAALYAAQADDMPVLEIGSPMEIGDCPAGNLGDVWAFTNGDEVKLYKNDVFVRSFRPEKAGLKHPPVKIDDTVGDLLRTQEGYTGEKERLLRGCLVSAGKYGFAGMPAADKLKMAYAMVKYHLTFDDGYRLYAKYVGNWGETAVRWRFDAVKDGSVTASVTKCPGNTLRLELRPDRTELKEGVSYDMAAVRIRVLDENGNVASYAQLPLQLKLEGCAELMSPSIITAEGGMTGTYLRTVGQSGEAVLKVSAPGLPEAVIMFTVTGGMQNEV